MQPLDNTQVREIERHAVELARGAGEILAGHFGKRIEVEFKDDKQRDPVTAADKTTQAYLAAEIARRFPEHGVLGEEATEEEKQSEEPARDILWVLDPLDGTTNFLNGLPVFASSIGVIHRGRPVAAALFIPWPAEGGGIVLHCHKGGGCYADDEQVNVLETEQPIPNRLIGLPGYFRRRQPLRRRACRQGGRASNHRQHRLRAGDDRPRRDAVRHFRSPAACGTWPAARWRSRRPEAPS